VLSNILIETEEGAVRLSGTDLDTAVSMRVPADVAEEGAITAPARKLQEIARELPPARSTSRPGGRDHDHERPLALPAERAAEGRVPGLPERGLRESWKVTGQELQPAHLHVSFAVSTEETRPILNGVLWELGEGEMRMVATNGHRLAKMTIPAESGGGVAGDLIVHPRALAQVQKLFRADEKVEVAARRTTSASAARTCRSSPG
jgi:DNA polymerase III subunit beta